MQTGNMTWQIPDPRRPEHWRHAEDHCKFKCLQIELFFFICNAFEVYLIYLDRGIYNTDVVDTDYDNWLLLLHCSDPEPNQKFLSTFVLSRSPSLDKTTLDYLREKVGYYDVDLNYLFPVNQTHCIDNGPKPEEIGINAL